MTAIIGGLCAAALWTAGTLASSRSSRMIGSTVVLGWIMLLSALIGAPVALATPLPAHVQPETIWWLAVASAGYLGGLGSAYAALRIGKVSIVAPIMATEGATAAVIAIALGDPITLAAAGLLGLIVVGVVCTAIDRTSGDVAVGDTDFVAEALDAPVRALSPTPPVSPAAARRSAILAILGALMFGVGLVAVGRAALVLPAPWIAVSSRVIGLMAITLPLAVLGRLRLTRAVVPLLLVSGSTEIFGSIASAWGARESVPIVAVLGSQFAALSAIVAFFLFGERLGRLQVLGVMLLVVGVAGLAATQA